MISFALAACATTGTGTAPLSAMLPPPPLATLAALPPVSPVLPSAAFASPAPRPNLTLLTDLPTPRSKPRARIIAAAPNARPEPKLETAALPPAGKIERPSPAPVSPPANTAPGPTPPMPLTGMAMGGAVPAPMGFTAFCRDYPAACRATPGSASFIVMTDRHMAELEAVNVRVNDAIWPRSDESNADVWSIAPDAGDCDDYAVTKRADLIRLGYPPAALLLTTARTEFGEKHLVLVVSTDRGDLVLDNRVNRIRDWRDVDYTWEARQSSINPKIWQTVASGSGRFAAID